MQSFGGIATFRYFHGARILVLVPFHLETLALLIFVFIFLWVDFFLFFIFPHKVNDVESKACLEVLKSLEM